ncbi:MAG: hypothetical protein H6Q87_692 [candidate division NC10 bacterium]|nr:hypothetical protein [candidate division NC10 bacterium]
MSTSTTRHSSPASAAVASMRTNRRGPAVGCRGTSQTACLPESLNAVPRTASKAGRASAGRNRLKAVPPPHRRAPEPQEGGAGEVHGADGPRPVEGQIRHRGQVVECGVPGQPRLAGLARLPELLVLQLQLHLADLELVEEPLGVRVGPGAGGPCRRGAHARFRTAAQRGGVGRWRRALRHGECPWGAWRPCAGRATLCTGHRGVSLGVRVSCQNKRRPEGLFAQHRAA